MMAVIRYSLTNSIVLLMVSIGRTKLSICSRLGSKKGGMIIFLQVFHMVRLP